MWPTRLPQLATQLVFKRYANGELCHISSFHMRNAVNDAGDRRCFAQNEIVQQKHKVSLNPPLLMLPPSQDSTWTTSCMTSSPCATQTSASTSALTVTSAASWGWRGCSVRPLCCCSAVLLASLLTCIYFNYNWQIECANCVRFLCL